jgi:hypothetical protein
MAEVFSDDTSAYTFAVRSDHPPSPHILQPCRCFLNPLFSAHNRWRGKAGGPHQLVVTMEDLAGPHAVPMQIPRPQRNNNRRQQAAAAQNREKCAQLMATAAGGGAVEAQVVQQLQSTRSPSSCTRRSMYPRRKKLMKRVDPGLTARGMRFLPATTAAAAAAALTTRQGKRDKYT